MFAAIVVMVSCNRPKETESEPVVPVQLAEVKGDSIQRIVSGQGILYAVDQASVVPKISAPIKAFYVKRGDHVSKGQLLAVLENRDLEAAVAEAKQLYEQAQSSQRAILQATFPEDINKAQTDLRSAQQGLEAAQKVYESRKQLFDQGALARRLVDEANVAFVQARSQFEVAQKHLQTLENVSRPEQAKGVEAQTQAAKARYDAAVAQLSYSEVRSPIAGVVADRPLYAGEMAASGTPLLTVMNISRVIVRTNIPVGQAGSVKVGDSAHLTQTDAALEADGKVTVVSPAVDLNSTTVEVWVETANPSESLRPGATVRAAILAETIQNAIVIPSSALLPAGAGETRVMVVGADSVAHERKIEIGVRESDKIQVLKGLQAGERVVTVGGVGLEDGAKVHIVAAGGAEKPEK